VRDASVANLAISPSQHPTVALPINKVINARQSATRSKRQRHRGMIKTATPRCGAWRVHARAYERPLHVPAYLPDFFILRLMPLGFRLGDSDFLRKCGYSLGGCHDCCGKRRAPRSFELPHAKAGDAKQER
jgi:hypothetical protein